MKKLFFFIVFVCLFVSTGRATYTYVIDTYQTLPQLTGTDTMLITGNGGGGAIYLSDSSSLTIKSTSTLNEGSGGVWEIHAGYNSHLTVSGGQVHIIDMGNSATATLTGGLIQQIWSYQWVPYTPGRDGVPVPNIKLYYSGNLPTYNETTDILTGLWGNGTGFSIYLHDVAGYDPVIENIEFILVPEPATLCLMGLGLVLLKKTSVLGEISTCRKTER
jgi:hypothetical protein